MVTGFRSNLAFWWTKVFGKSATRMQQEDQPIELRFSCGTGSAWFDVCNSEGLQMLSSKQQDRPATSPELVLKQNSGLRNPWLESIHWWPFPDHCNKSVPNTPINLYKECLWDEIHSDFIVLRHQIVYCNCNTMLAPTYCRIHRFIFWCFGKQELQVPAQGRVVIWTSFRAEVWLEVDSERLSKKDYKWFRSWKCDAVSINH